ncbi:MAG TPA: hypothetical protein DCL16_03050 [Acidimicrobiaceae bacterium]|nr:hypothetical protein [Acidimicrobiaceae bacterium]
MSLFGLLSQQSQTAVGTGSQKWWLLVAALFLVSLFLSAVFIKVWRRTLPPARAPYIPPDLVFSVVEEIDLNEKNETRQVEPGLGSGDGRWIQPPRND